MLIQNSNAMTSKHQKTLGRIERKYGVEFILDLYENFERSYYQTNAFGSYAGFKSQIAQVYNEASTDWKNFVQAQKTELL